MWLTPQYSTIASRSVPDLSSALSPSVKLKHPVIASNMASVSGIKMAKTIDTTGSLAILHRFMSKDELCGYAENDGRHMDHFAFSVGVKPEDINIANRIFDILGNKAIILVDIAHGHTKLLGDTISAVKKIGYETVIAGNVATKEGYKFLVDHGADAVRVGIAGGKACTTKYVTGHHVPTLQSVIDCNEEKERLKKPIIADGGISTSGDAAKAIAAGADFVCVGSILASTSDSPADIVYENQNGVERIFKEYYGMSSQTAIKKFFGDSKKHVAPEGTAIRLPYTGETIDVLSTFLAGLRSALTYSGAENIQDFQECAILMHK